MHRNGYCSSCDKPTCPFLTVVTRCYKRPEALRRNIRSLKTQTDPDYEQVFIFDKKGHGLAAADQALNKYRDVNCGNYIMVLDDDDIVVDPQFIEKLKMIKETTSPDIIIWKAMFSNETHILPPDDGCWGKRPVRCAIGSFNYCISHALYTKYIHVCKTGETGDFDFINRVYHSKEKPKIEWVDSVFVSCQYRSAGKTEEKETVIITAKEHRNKRVYRTN